MNKKIIFLLLTVFILGWISSSSYHSFTNTSTETTLVLAQAENITDVAAEPDNDSLYEAALQEFQSLQELFDSEAAVDKREKDSPHDWIPMEDIHVYNNRVVIDIDNPEWALFTDTNSMDPVLDAESNAIEIIPKTYEDVHVGDIVAYESKYATGIITHRVIETGFDSDGWYARMKGDNNPRVDPGKVRFDQVKRIIVAIIY